MSVKALDAVWYSSQSRGAARLVLLALADEASDQGLVTAYRRSHSHLARKANVDDSTVWRSIDKLVELGELLVLRVGTGRESSDYRIAIEGLQDADPRAEGLRGADPQGPRGATPGTAGRGPHHPVGNPTAAPVESSGALAVRELTFDDFWRAYPSSQGKRAAEKAWATAVRRADPAVIVAGAERYRDDPNRDPSFTKYAQGWLNADRWLDGPLPPRSDGRGPTRMERTLQNAAAFLAGEGGDDEQDRGGNGAREARRGLPPGR